MDFGINKLIYIGVVLICTSCVNQIELSGKARIYSGPPLKGAIIYIENDNRVIDSTVAGKEGEFNISFAYEKNLFIYAKTGCCSSIKEEITKEKQFYELKIQSYGGCSSQKSNEFCNPIDSEKFYAKMVKFEDYPYVHFEKGSDLLEKDTLRIEFYTEIHPTKYYKFEAGDSIRGQQLIELKKYNLEDKRGNILWFD